MLKVLRPSIWRRSRRITLGVQAAVVDSQRGVLLIRHGYRPGWHFPGGGVERGESIETALVRETLEETGVVVEDMRLFGLYTHFDVFPGDHIAVFKVERWRQPQVPAPNSEIAEQGFFPLDALPSGTTPQTRSRIAELLQQTPRSSAW